MNLVPKYYTPWKVDCKLTELDDWQIPGSVESGATTL